MKMHTRPGKMTDRLKIAWVLFCRALGNGVINLSHFLLYRKASHPQKILVFRTGSIGDSICAMPAVSNIRAQFPQSKVHLLTNAGTGHQNLVSFEALVSPAIFDKIINYEGIPANKLARLLREEGYDLVIHLTQYEAPLRSLLRDMVFFRFFAGIKSGWGWQFNRFLSFRQEQAKYLALPNERDRLIRILQRNGVAAPGPDRFPFNIRESDSHRVKILLSELPLSDRPTIAIVPGAKRPQNRWPVSHFSEVIRHYSPYFNIFLIGGENDLPQVRPLLEFPNTYSFCGLLTPLQSGLLMQHCLLVLSNDTGPMHLAYGFGVPVVALFSNRDFPDRWFPPIDRHNVVLRAQGIACAVCLSETCADNICMKKIGPEEVVSVMDRVISLLVPGNKYQPAANT